MHRLGQTERQGVSKVVPLDERKIVKTFMVKNFPPSCSEKDLIAAFQEVRPVVDLFCPRKRDAQGKKFGFVRMMLDKEEEGEETLERLNSIWMSSYKIRAIVPRYERKAVGESKVSKKPTAAPIPKEPINKVVSPTVREDGRTYASVAQGCRCICKANQQIEQKITFIPTEEEIEWLEKARVGCLKEGYQWEDHADEIQEEVQWQYEIKSLGEDLILIKDREETTPAKERLTEWEHHWFKWVRGWKPEDVSRRRAVWTKWYGVPLHTWSERFFRQICLRLGAFLDWDKNTKEKLKLDSARIKIWGDTSKFINEIITVTVDRKEFKIRIVEEIEWEANVEESDSDDASADSETFSGEASCNDEDFEFDGFLGDEIAEALMSTGLEVSCEGGGTFPREKGSDDGRVGSLFEAEGKTAPSKSDNLCGVSDYKLEEGEVQQGVENTSLGPELEPDKRKSASVYFEGIQNQENKAQLSAEESLPFPPGWGPNQTENAAHLQTCTQAQISTDSLPYPPGWGPNAEFTNCNERNIEGAEHTDENGKEGERDSDRERQCQNLIQDSQNRAGKGKMHMSSDGDFTSKVESATENDELPEQGGQNRRTKKKGRKVPRAKEKLKPKKRVEKRREREQLSFFLKDMHSPNDRVNCRRSEKVNQMGKKKKAQVRKEAEEVVNIGRQLGLQPTAPENILVGKIEELIATKRKEEEEGLRRRNTDLIR